MSTLQYASLRWNVVSLYFDKLAIQSYNKKKKKHIRTYERILPEAQSNKIIEYTCYLFLFYFIFLNK